MPADTKPACSKQQGRGRCRGGTARDLASTKSAKISVLHVSGDASGQQWVEIDLKIGPNWGVGPRKILLRKGFEFVTGASARWLRLKALLHRPLRAAGVTHVAASVASEARQGFANLRQG